MARIEATLAAARARTTFATDEPVEIQSTKGLCLDLTDTDPPVDEIIPQAPPEVFLAVYEEVDLPSPPRWSELRYATSETLHRIITRIAEVEGPVHKEVVIERIRQCYCIGRVRGSTRDRLEQAIRFVRSSGPVLGDGTFIWFEDDQLSREPRRPADRNIEHVPPTELEAFTVTVDRVMFGVPRRELANEVARGLGFNRTGGRISEVMEATIQKLLNEGVLIESFSMIHAAS